MIACLLSALLTLTQTKTDAPVRLPAGWEGSRQEGMFVAVPKDLAEGKLYTFVVPELSRKLGSLKALLDAAKATLADVGAFSAVGDPAHGTNDAGWEYDAVIGKLEKNGKVLLAQAVVLRKGDEEAIFLVLSDGVETMGKYADPFTAMLRSHGAPKPPPAPLAEGVPDLRYTLPEGWAAQTLEGGILLTRTQDTREYRLLILASRPIGDSLQKAFLTAWTAHVMPAIETKIVPLPLMRRMKSGMACAVDIDSDALNKNGVKHHGGLYVLARGTRCVPILAFFFGLGNTDDLDKALQVLFESADIPGSGTDNVTLFNPAALAGTWTESSAFYGTYVTRAGNYAGDASIATGATFELRADRTFKKTLIAVGGGTRIKEVDEGTWTVEDAELLLAIKDKIKRYRIFGTGADPKVGTFLVLSTYHNTDQRVDLPIPRRLFSGNWYKRKD